MKEKWTCSANLKRTKTIKQKTNLLQLFIGDVERRKKKIEPVEKSQHLRQKKKTKYPNK